MADAFLTIDKLQSGYGDVQVLWDISVAVERGGITCIVGSNGAGKTTLLRTISGLLKPRGGSIRLDGAEIGGLDPDGVLARGIAHVPEGRRLFKGLTVQDNLLLGAYLRRDRPEIEADLNFVYDMFPILKDRRKQDATTLSGGEQQMCAIGRGLLSRPKLLMIDELSLGLAPRLVEKLGESLIEINRTGLTILLVEQDVLTAFEIARHAFVIETGRVSMAGTTADLGENPKIREAYMGI
ncbi:ABC transporter ATP-binding protein [Oceanibaculum nanhaiense]|mgnify:FL=1|jgi:branched-chain amino acid transport system ATP-binding protein|uniref:ABC transporter ATP-binding protein n=1 Tax=Oceanibaculum nanhaiense TaxID=1909734 RepID=UPI000A372918|nr:ABC transporter ATP-binding protein [Oceanibaculum nanhaiense]MBC7136906.1 ABC transporter ATP-binding protein [Oceanibaculum nanhaiense]MDM7946633.1 ABC transporter ATP-binding protein [Oceanibaculum nanhaiense]